MLSSGLEFANENKDAILAAGKLASNLLAAKKEYALETGDNDDNPDEKIPFSIPIADYNLQLDRLVEVLVQM